MDVSHSIRKSFFNLTSFQIHFCNHCLSGYVINFPIRPPGRNPCEAVADVTEEFNRWAVTNLNAANPTCLARIQEVSLYTK